MQWWSVPQEWPGETVFIVAGGTSVLDVDLEQLRGRKVIALNSSYERVPWADFLLFADNRWYRLHEHKIQTFRGRIVSLAPNARPSKRILHLQAQDPPGLSADPRKLVMKRTVLAAAMNLAAHLTGPDSGQVLLGADGREGKAPAKGAAPRTHHHHPHPWPQRQGCWDEQRRDLESLVKPLKKLRITVRNASPGSAWPMWPIVELGQCL